VIRRLPILAPGPLSTELATTVQADQFIEAHRTGYFAS
jgi:hypothetical protein